MVCDAILLKAVEEGCWCVLHLRLLDNNNTLEVGVYTRRFQVGPNCNVGVVASSLLGIINPAKALIEEIVEAFMDVIGLGHQHSVAFNGRMANGCNCIYLGREGKGVGIFQSVGLPEQNCSNALLLFACNLTLSDTVMYYNIVCAIFVCILVYTLNITMSTMQQHN